jgi:hypothetical protein
VRGLLPVLWLVPTLLGGPAQALAGPSLAVEPAAFDFGEVRQQRTLSKEFRLMNIGDAELQLVRITTSCGCTVVEPGAKVVAPGASTLLRVELQTRDDCGGVVRSVLVGTNDPERPRVVIELRATVVE